MSKSKFHIIGKVLKFKYWKWSCIFYLMLWAKSYGKKKAKGEGDLGIRLKGIWKFDYWLFQWYKECLIWTKCTPCIFFSNIWKLVPHDILIPFSPKKLLPFSSTICSWGSCSLSLQEVVLGEVCPLLPEKVGS